MTTFGSPLKILVDNGGEFANSSFISFAENFNLRIKTTAGESPWSNGTVEKHNGLIGQSIDKICEEADCPLDVALAWAVSAKNSLSNVHGYSPNQMVFGRNPNYPCVLTNYPPALEGKSVSEVVAMNVNAMNSARRHCIQLESSDKIRRALKYRVRPSSNIRYFVGDEVFYKRKRSKEWRGPASVIGQLGQEVLVKHSSFIYRVHPCQLKLIKEGENRSYGLDLDMRSNAGNTEMADKTVTLVDNSDSEDEDSIPDSPEMDSSEQAAQIPEIPLPNSENAICSDPSSTSGVLNGQDKLKKNLCIRYALKSNPDNIIAGQVTRRTGKASGKYKNFWEVKNTDGQKVEIDFENEVSNWQPSESSVSSPVENVLFVDQTKEDAVHDAKLAELQSWKDNDVYEEVHFNNQFCISTRWVITEKIVDSKVKLKARLVARGFEESDMDMPKDSPTCSKQSFRLMLTVIASKGWQCNSIDVKTAFLQGKPINRNVYLTPPRECSKKDVVWLLKKCVYGLNDASRTWYMRLLEELLKLNVKVSRFDAGLFFWHRNEQLEGVLITHVDDICWGGSDMFYNMVITKLYTTFLIGAESKSAFTYIGLNLKQTGNFIEIDQNAYIQAMQPLVFDKNRKRDEKLSVQDQTSVRKFAGQLNWLGTQTRPDIMFDCCRLMSCISTATVDDLHKANKCLRKVKVNNVTLQFYCLDDLCNVHFKVFCDASFGNMINGGSQGGYIVFMCDATNNHVPIHWQSHRVQRVVKSTLAAETLALVEAAESCFWLRKVFEELVPNACCTITLYTDNKSLQQSVYSTTLLRDRRLMIDMAVIREMLLNKEINSVKWIDTKSQLADCLTKEGASSEALLAVLCGSKLQ